MGEIMIKREKYLSKIRGFYNSDLIKVIIGIRRCGKSVLLKQIIDELKNMEIDDSHIIYINFEDVDYSFIKDYMDLNKFIKERIVDGEKYYLFFDEIQLVKEWEKVINSFRATLNTSIFITGSNSKLLSGELATLLSGRYVSFKIFPFTFREIVELKNENDKNKLEDIFDDYLLWGGLPQKFEFGEDIDKVKTYLIDVFSSIVIKDIIKRYNISNVNLFQRIIEYLVTNSSQTFSPTNMLNEFQKEEIPISTRTVYECLDYVEASLLMSKISTYDIRGKRILSRKDKYYLTDLGIGQILNTNKKMQMGAYLENIVYNELLYRGYNVSIGNNNGREIDFVATRFNEKIYIQVAYILADDSVIEREFGAYKGIDDNYPKYVITLDKYDMSQNGIIHMNIIDWLLKEEV